MVSPSRRALVDELAAFDRLLEVGVGNRPGVACALATRGRHVVAIDVIEIDVAETVDAVDAAGTMDAAGTADTADTAGTADTADTAGGDRSGSLRLRRGDVVALADDPNPLATVLAGEDPDPGEGRVPTGIDAVYACNLPAELQRPTVALADRLDAACLFTTLGFEEPTVPVRRRSVPGETLFVARSGRQGSGRGAGGVPGAEGSRSRSGSRDEPGSREPEGSRSRSGSRESGSADGPGNR